MVNSHSELTAVQCEVKGEERRGEERRGEERRGDNISFERDI